MSSHVHELIYENHKTSNDPWISEEHLEFVDMSIEQYTSRIGCHIILLPSGFETSPLSLVESTGAHIYGKLLYGGVNRFRLLNLALSKKSKGFHHRTYTRKAPKVALKALYYKITLVVQITLVC